MDEWPSGQSPRCGRAQPVPCGALVSVGSESAKPRWEVPLRCSASFSEDAKCPSSHVGCLRGQQPLRTSCQGWGLINNALLTALEAGEGKVRVPAGPGRCGPLPSVSSRGCSGTQATEALRRAPPSRPNHLQRPSACYCVGSSDSEPPPTRTSPLPCLGLWPVLSRLWASISPALMSGRLRFGPHVSDGLSRPALGCGA